MSEEQQPDGEATLRVVAMPSDVNINGDIFGGWVLSQMDIASGIVAAQRAKGRVTTVAVDAMKFIRPVQVGNILCVWASVARVGRSSMAIKIEAWAVRHRRGISEKVTEAIFTYVAIDEDGNPRPVPQEDAPWPQG
ncbi:acyl-CoA thioesterase [Shimia sp. R11_0]|uniref:acyl-CoA thioesterase n=1 Tax=Shimia sp. R11_0 TaxID=2821096 RepID=UPI001ADA7B05|nr:acyl-CoA thioesterase [Shimia sp. R11_0]MBO9478224.1 acyl-CoA thioesterase [Shimia sp. R11_0]